MRKLAHLKLSLMDVVLGMLQLSWQETRERQLRMGSLEKLLARHLQSPSDHSSVSLVTPRPADPSSHPRGPRTLRVKGRVLQLRVHGPCGR